MLLPVCCAQVADTLPGTARLGWNELDLSTRLMDGAHAFVDRKLAESAGKRRQHWSRDASSPAAYVRSVEPNREHLRTIIGVVDPRLPANMERFGDDANPALVAETARYRVFQVRWPVLERLWGTGLLVQPKDAVKGRVVMVPDAGQSPEELIGLTSAASVSSTAGVGARAAARLAENGFELVIPVTIRREKMTPRDGVPTNTDQTHREWIYRQAFHLGRHVIGYEVQTALAAVDWFRARDGASAKIGLCGYGEGGAGGVLRGGD